MIRIGVLGYGYWGPNLARNIAASRLCRIASICDRSPSRLAAAAQQYPGIALQEHSADLISDPNIDAIAIATPVRSHFELAMAALQAGKHVLVEKPLCSTSGQALALIEESERRRLVLMVDHTYVFAPEVRAIKEAVRNQELGDLWYWDSTRLNLGLIRGDANVVWDLASHDFGILDHVLPSAPCALKVAGMAPRRGGLEHLAYLTVHFPDGLLAHIHASWISPVKIRRTTIGGSRRMLVYDDGLANKVAIHDCGFEENACGGEVTYRRGGTRNVPHRTEEPLFRAVEHFAACVAGSRRPIVDGEAGLRIVRLLEAADASLESGGCVISLDSQGVAV